MQSPPLVPGRRPADDARTRLTVSVVVPLYNKREQVGASLASVAAQSRAADEIVVVDDGSTDGSGELARDAPGVRYVHQANAGPAVARNRGIELAGGDAVAFLDADDRWAPDKLAVQLAFLEAHPELAWCACNFRTIRPDGPACVRYPADDGWTVYEDWFDAHAARDRMLTSGVVVRRSALAESGGFDASIRHGQDGELWTRIALSHPAYGYHGRPLFDYLDVAGSVSSPSRRRLESRLQVARLHLERSRALGHAGYRRYARRKGVSVVRDALSHGEPDVARALLPAVLADGPRGGVSVYAALARLPGPLLRVGSRAYRGALAARRRRPRRPGR